MTKDHYDELIPCDPLITDSPAINHWSINPVSNGNGDNFLESGEIFVLNLKLLNSLPAYEDFTVEIQPPKYSVMTLRREIPPGLGSKNYVVL